MTHDDAFLQAILAAPDGDAPRLAYADWLEEHGQPDRAAFIRVQCYLALLPAGDPRRPELEARERSLLKEHGEEWAGPLRGLVGGWEFRRGFVEEVVFGERPTPGQLAAVRRLAPVRKFISVTCAGGE